MTLSMLSLWCWPLPCNLEKCYSLRSSFGMYNLEIQLWYWHLLTRHCPCNLLPEPTSPKHEYKETLRRPCDIIDDVITLKKRFFDIIWHDLFISEVRFKLCLISQNFKTGTILSSRQTFVPKVIPEVEYTRKIAMSISDILSFWSTL